MSLNFGSLIANAASRFSPTQWSLKAQVEWARILEKPVDVQFTREGSDTPLDPQTVRLEMDGRLPSQIDDDSGISSESRLTIFGVRGHPDIDDLDVKIWDTFVYEDVEYTVLTVNRVIVGQIQAYCAAVG